MEDRENSKTRYIQEREEHDNLKTFVLGDLKKLGIKPPKVKRKVKDDNIDETNQSVFGNHLCNVPSLMVEGCGPVPRFLVEGTELLHECIDTEGLFRKSGSVARQKELKDKIDHGERLQDAHPYDVASLIKQFFRELPDALLTTRFHDTFLKCQSIESECDRLSAVHLLCLLLPWHHLSTLRFFAEFLANIARNSEQNKMDVNNLAVCLAPNLLHINCKAEKMKDSESKSLQAQTNVVQILIEHADDIGMVTDTLHDQASLMGSLCFPSDDELEKSGDELDDSRPNKNKKKKKRSGSLQGLVSNLSSSFSKWRRDSKGHNSSSISDKSSMLSIMSTDTIDASCSSEDSPDMLDIQASLMGDMQTPKVMRKRKASNEMLPFSASKKKAILQQMPQMSTLGTPYTPANRRRQASGHEFALGTPSIKFADGSSQMVFTATPTEPTPVGPTPRRKMDRILSPSSAMKVKRHPPGKAGCFSPKTPKSAKRRSVRGFFRRLSGGKEQSPGSHNDSSDMIGSRLTNGTGPIIMRPGSAGKKKGGFFRRHKKTPSSPARLVTNLANTNAADTSYDVANCTAPPQSGSLSSSESITSLEVAAQLSEHLHVPKQHRRGCSADGTPINTSGLRRGRPNTVAVGLPEPYNRRSFDQGSLGSSPVHAPSHPPRHSSQREIFTSPKRHEHLECSPVAFDTSPIPKADFQMLDCSPIGGGDQTMEIDGKITIEDSRLNDTSPCVSRHDYSSSLCQEGPSNATMGDANMTQLESDHEKAFIIEESMCTENLDETSVKNSAGEEGAAAGKPETVFKKPFNLPVPVTRKKDLPQDSDSDPQLMDASISSDASDTSVITVIYNGQPVSSKPTPPIPARKDELAVPSENETSIETSPGLKSRDSGVDLSAAGCTRPEQCPTKMSKSSSVQSMTSLDSGLGMDTGEQEETGHPCVKKTETRATPAAGRSQEQIHAAKGIRNRNASFRALKEGARPVIIQKRMASTEPRTSAEPHLRVSAEMHHMLSRVGVVDDKSRRGKHAPFIALPNADTEMGEQTEKQMASSHESVKNLLENGTGRVAATAKQFTKSEAEEVDVVERHTSPLRFPNSTSRRGGASPIRIPTIFAKADEEAAMYREVARHVMRGSPKSGVRARPILPISTKLVRSSSVESARKRLSSSNLQSPEQVIPQTSDDRGLQHSNDTAGHTPVRPPVKPTLQSVEINDSLLETINDVCTPKMDKPKGSRSPLKDNTNAESSETLPPRLKPPMLVKDVGSRFLAKSLHNAMAGVQAKGETPVCKYKGPVKSVKRLQGSPHSPRSPAKSPKRYQPASKPAQLSPIPQHLLNWNV